MKTYKTIECPVPGCGKKYLSHAMKLHIINKGRYEAHRMMMNMLHASKRKEHTFSSIVVLRQMPHIAFRMSHTKEKIKLTFDL